MAQTTSGSTGRPYGVQRVCSAWDQPRSSYYTRQARAQRVEQPAPLRRGPKPAVADTDLLNLIKADLEASLFVGEGHRKVYHRLRRVVKVGRHRVLRVMRENGLLSPHRMPKAALKEHLGHIITDAPNIMWATDGTKVLTWEDGYVWIFAAVEHWNAECVGWHVCKVGHRFAALQPVAMGLERIYGSAKADVAPGLQVHMDFGSQYTSEDFLSQIRFWGMTPTFALVGEPETNGVVERFFRTLKEQVIHGRTFRGVEDLKQAVDEFMLRYNRSWLVEKNGFISPEQARSNHLAQLHLKAAA